MSGPCKVLVLDGVSRSGLRVLLEDARFEISDGADGPDGASDEAVGRALAEAEGLIVRSATRVTDELLEGAPRLRVVGRAGVGVDNIDLEAATRRGVAVLNAPAGNTVSAAELALALLLAVARRIPSADRSVRAGEWARSRFGGMELRGKTLGLVGAGRIGGEVARRASAFGMSVIAHDPYLSGERAEDLGVGRVSLDELIATADVVSLHVPLTDATRGMIGAARLAAMKDTAILVNASRGGVVVEEELVEALRAGTIAGAALDVYAEEPLPADSPLRDAPNLVLTPHLGASTAEAQELVAEEIARAVRDCLMEGDLSRALNAPAIGAEALRRLRPALELGRRLGRLAEALTTGPAVSLEIGYAGESSDALSPLSAYALMGLLAPVVGADGVNFVNARHLAEQRGMEVSLRRLARKTAYTEYVEVSVRAENGAVEVAGALLGEHHPRIVRIGQHHIDLVPQGSVIILRNRDVPGVIGRVGTLLGEAGLNIAEYHQSRLSEGGEALAAVSVDGKVDDDLVGRLRALAEVADARLAELR